MSSDERPDERRADEQRPMPQGGTTAVDGTPMAVDIGHHHQARLTWIAFLAGPVIWFGHFMLVYTVAEAGCTGAGAGLRFFDPPVPVLTTIVTTPLAAIACLGAAFWAYRRWRGGTDTSAPVTDGRFRGSGDDERGGSLAFAGMLLSLVSFLSVLFVGVSALFLQPC